MRWPGNDKISFFSDLPTRALQNLVTKRLDSCNSEGIILTKRKIYIAAVTVVRNTYIGQDAIGQEGT